MISASSEPFKIFAFLVVMKIHSNVLLFFLIFHISHDTSQTNFCVAMRQESRYSFFS